jgi:hypothetical protein
VFLIYQNREEIMMKVFKLAICLCLATWLAFAIPATARSASESEPYQETLQSLLDDLQRTVNDADKRMVAHPKFLDELRALIARYKARLRPIYLYEDFADGNYTASPRWKVQSGQFRLVPGGRLWSRVLVERQSQPSSSSSSKKEEPLGLLLKEILKASQDREQREQQEAAPREEEPAVIATLAKIGPAFEMDLSFISDSRWGSTEFVLMGGNPATPGYRLIYYAAPSRDRPIEIVRQRGSRQYTIEAASRFPDLDDGKIHRIQWTRDERGVMKVLVDGQEILSTVEFYYQDNFSGFALINRGGTYEYGPIKILQAKKTVQ